MDSLEPLRKKKISKSEQNKLVSVTMDEIRNKKESIDRWKGALAEEKRRKEINQLTAEIVANAPKRTVTSKS